MEKRTPRLDLFIWVALVFFLWVPAFHVSADEAKEHSPETKEPEKGAQEDEEGLRDLLSVLDKHTEIATKSKLNADYVPGMVTVLGREDMLVRGIRNVEEALALVPGMDVITGPSGDKSLSVRGLAADVGGGSNQFMLNGVLFNMAFAGNNFAILGIPIEQVQRIEVIRGPGSALHGGYANTGVINVITRSEGTSLYGEAASYDTYGAGGLLSWSDPERDLSIGLNLAGWDTDGADTQSGPDTLYAIGQGDISNAPGPANEDRSARSATLNLGYRDFSFLAEYLNTGVGDRFGRANALPPDEDGIVYEVAQWAFELAQRFRIGSDFRTDIKLGYMGFEQSTADRVFLMPPGFTTPDFTYPYGMFSALYYAESRINGALSLTWEGWRHHKLFAEWSMSQTHQGDDTWWAGNFSNPDTLEPSPTNTMQRFDDGIIGADRKRFINSLVVQDEYEVTPALTVTAGARFDHYNDTEDNLAPRLAGVYRLTDAHILKAQYAEAYRPPSFLELYSQTGVTTLGNDQLAPQISKNYELGYIYRGKDRVGRVTLFHTDLEDVVVPRQGQWTNSGGAHLKGVELELEQPLFSFLKIDANLSYVNTEDKDTNEPIERTPNWLANAGLLYEVYSNLTLGLQYRYIGEQNRSPVDTRDKLEASHSVDVTASLFNLWARGLTLRTGVKNLFDADVRYAAPANTYPEDYPLPGRRWWVQISYDF
ncbi:MAG: TonB-dependent receptor [Desulfobacterales bacterium]|nr:TonB-dependent receptor [Desulfobacterales bacterium]